MKLPVRQLGTVLFSIVLLVAIIVGKSRCANSVNTMFKVLDQPANPD